MPIPEIIKFRQKYPEYNDMDDLTLVTKLAAKYPEYSDLVDKVKMGQQQTATPQKKSLLPPLPQNWVLSGLEQTRRELMDIPQAHFINQFSPLPNLPRAVAAKMGYEYPEAQSVAGNILAKGAGIAGGIMNPISKIYDLGKLKAGAKLGAKMLQGAKSGALYGGLSTPTEDIVGIPQRMGQAAAGAILGGLGVGASEGIQKGVREFRKFKAPARPAILQRIGWQRQDWNKVAQEKARNLRLDNLQAQNVITDNIKQLDDELAQTVQTGAIDIQERLPKFFRANSDAYGQRLNEISDNLGENFTKGKANKILADSLNEMGEEIQGKPRQIIEYLANEKYGLVKTDKEGNIIAEFAEDTPINFKDFKNDITQAWKALSTTAKAGQKYSQDDVALAILQKNFGEYVAQEVPEFAQLQVAYKPVVEVMKEAGRQFKPYAGEVTNLPGANLLKKYSVGTATPQQEKLLTMLQEGSEFAPGLGDITSPSKRIGESLSRAGELQKETRFATQKKLQEINIGKQARLNQLEERRRKVAELLANKQRAMRLRNTILKTSGAAAAATEAGYLLHRTTARTMSP